jgi:hypothetical protein
VWRKRAFCALQVNQRYAQNHRAAHDIKPDSNATHGVPFDEHTPNSDVAWYFYDLARLGMRTTLNRILRGRNTPQALYLQVRDWQWLFFEYTGRGNDQYLFGQGETAK